MKIFKAKLFFLLITSLFMCGCASNEYYRDKAAESAREFLFDDLEHISPENKAYIRFTYPEILQAPIIPDNEYSQLCFAWNLPSPNITLLVYGSSRNDFKDWYPLRVIFKKYNIEETASMSKVDLDKVKVIGESSDKINFRTVD